MCRKKASSGDAGAATAQRAHQQTPPLAGKSTWQRFGDRIGRYELARIAIVRLLGLMFLCAFSVAYNQAPLLIGTSGLYPAAAHLKNVQQHYGDSATEQVPTLFWWTDLASSDTALRVTAAAGIALSLFMLLAGRANMLLVLALWALQTSFHSVGQLFWGFGWEIQLLETSFLCAFLCAPLSLARFPKQWPAGFVPVLLLRWLLFRIMIGAGLIKIRGDEVSGRILA
jgi:hypothetical protein